MTGSTYAFVFNGSDWKRATSDDDWDISVVELDGKEKLLGHRQIDGSLCKVFQSADGKIVAVSTRC